MYNKFEDKFMLNSFKKGLLDSLQNYYESIRKIFIPMKESWIDNYFFLTSRNLFIDKRSGEAFSCLSFDEKCHELVPCINGTRENADHYVFEHNIMVVDKEEYLQGVKEMFLHSNGLTTFNTAYNFKQVI